jgi:fatty-acyl-CoA synthase
VSAVFAPPVFPAHPDPLRFWRGQAPARTALVDRSRGQRYTYAELDAGAERWAGLLRGAGVRPGDLVAVLAGNRREVVEAFYGCGRMGAALLPLNWRLSAAELAPIVADARPALVLGEERFRALAEAVLGAGDGPRWIDVDHDAPRLLDRAEVAPDVPRGPEDAALILYTSGSTGRPKGAVLPHRQIHWNAVATTTGWELGHADVAPVSTPFFHTGGWNVFATPLWHRGGTVVLFDGFDADTFLDGLDEEGCTAAMVVPTQLVMLTERPGWGRALPSLRFLISGGAPCPSSLATRTRAAGYRFREGFGLTECGPNCFAISDDDAVARGGSVGRPVPHLQMRLDAGGRDAEPGEPGELLLRGPQMFAGYLRDPERTAEALTEDGWLRTGDLARRDREGFYTICGRRKEMYISGGENVFPSEVEAVLADCPGVAEAVVVGVPDERWGEVGRAYVVPRAGQSLSDQTVLEHARSRLARFKVPRSLAIVSEIPRLGSGKPDRRALASQVEVIA